MLRIKITKGITAGFLALAGMAGSADAQGVGTQVPNQLVLRDFAQTGARSYDDLLGRAVLLEFFAHW